MKSRRLQSARFVSVWFCALAVAGGAILSFGVGAQYASGRRRELQGREQSMETPGWALRDRALPKTLVSYVFSDTDPEYRLNLLHFLNHITYNRDPADYVIIMNGGKPDDFELPEVPPNVRFLAHPNECFDMGTHGWVLSGNATELGLDIKSYKYILFLNSSVRGPYLPTYLLQGPLAQPWHALLTANINNDIKLVGPTINCQSFRANDPDRKPHVQSYCMATDQVGLGIMLEKGVLSCKQGWVDAIVTGELAASKVLLNEGYNIASLLTKYRGLDWRDRRNWDCNNLMNPIGYDEINAQPLEVMFVKAKSSMTEWVRMRLAVELDQRFSVAGR
ncbi:hypothetical protein KFL_007030030 [Klebsormidium nitens]|uniref:Uncharacterized protein n=1 Tax=Klebsormidium nitens TaxID=105231 RepID=A0A1Y1IJ97_KLENI|nr:hypothetical protein KFL_007030030 [Klebsormidium nitens]|eukprot:GAQ90930.1 hypothetical protein KFL_007030030 [Klebsormidium nitens]